MADIVSTTVKDDKLSLCTSSNEHCNLIDEIPSLDALSFEREHCPHRNCLCHNRKHPQNGGNGSGLSAFGVQPPSVPVLAQKPASFGDYTTGLKNPLSSLSLAQPTLQLSSIGHPVASSSDAADKYEWVFGSGSNPHSADHMQSFAQLCISEGSQVATSQTFDNNHRLPADSSYDSAQEFNLSELQSALLTTAEESLSVSDCPLHRHANSIERFPSCTCGQQASRLDDCTFDELAAYLDNFCYIPKNMSPMAEMMYM